MNDRLLIGIRPFAGRPQFGATALVDDGLTETVVSGSEPPLANDTCILDLEPAAGR
ncbi:MAG: hypothetical protein HYY25_13275 [Candidatus Wallbacteria bacterium]|nr:hypothetical protein [Candidatus Wallbacteria bacterium]